MKLVCYAIDAEAPTIRPAQQTRAWMDGVIDNHAYRCLPLSIANSYGWDILAPFAFSAQWNGEPHPSGLILRCDDGSTPPLKRVASHFGYGIVTFQLSYLFRTEPGWDLVASGPWNRPKDGIAALTGVIETDWLPFPFTMNWQMTRPGTVRFPNATNRFARSFRSRAKLCRASNPRSLRSTIIPMSKRKRKSGRSDGPI